MEFHKANLKKMCHLLHADDLIILMASRIKDLRIIKLILLPFEDILRLEINFKKETKLYSIRVGQLPTTPYPRVSIAL